MLVLFFVGLALVSAGQQSLPGSEKIILADPGVKDLYIPRPSNTNSGARLTSKSVFNINFIGNWTPQARAAFEYAISVWEDIITSEVEITVDAQFSQLSNPNALAGAYANLIANTQDIPEYYTWYPQALANKYAKTDIFTNQPDMVVSINSSADWYYGTDGNTPSNQYDFVTVMIHEVGHGLGFFSSARTQAHNGGTVLWYGYQATGLPYWPAIYDNYVVNGSGQRLTSLPIASSEPSVWNFLQSNDLYWDGPNAQDARLFAPNPFQQGSSISHLDENTYVNNLDALMSPAISKGEAIHDPGGLVLGILKDIGWQNILVGIEDELSMRGSVNGQNYWFGDLPQNWSSILVDYIWEDEEPFGDYITSQEYKVTALHDAGEVTLKTSTAPYMYLTPSDLVLPSGYNWKRNADGKIKVRVSLEGLDNDGITHTDGYFLYLPEAPNAPSIEFLPMTPEDCGKQTISFYGAGATEYLVDYKPSNSSSWSTVTVNGNTYSHTFENLDGEFQFKVRAVNAHGVTGSGTITKLISPCISGMENSGLEFDRDQYDRARIPFKQDYNIGTGDFTVEAWINVSNVNYSSPTVFSNRSLWNNGIECFLYQGRPYIRVTTVNYPSPVSLDLYDNKCHHIAWIRKNNEVEFVVDGQSLGKVNPGIRNISTGADLYLGYDQKNHHGARFNGSIRDVRFWNTARTVEQVDEFKDALLDSFPSNLIGYWPLDEGSGQVIHDKSINASHGYLGTNSGVSSYDPEWVTLCPPEEIADESLQFNRSQKDRVTVPHLDEYSVGTGDFTVEAWVNLSSSQNSFPTVFSNRSSHWNGFKFFFYQGKLYVRVTNTNYTAPVQVNMYDGQCHHVAFVRKGTIGEYFLDGQSLGTSNIGIRNINTSRDLWIGHDYNSNSTPLDGAIKEVRFWNKARTQQNIQDDMFNQLHGTEHGLIGYWKLDEGSGQVAQDHSRMANNGSLGANSTTETIDPTWSLNGCGNNNGAKEASLVDEVKIALFNAYPNPFGHQLSIDLSTSDASKAIMRVFDAKGTLVEEVDVSGFEYYEIGNNWDAGIYLIQIVDDANSSSVKVLKE